MGLLSTQPFSTVYALGAIGFELIRFPLWVVKYVTSYGRQHSKWTLRQAIGVRLFYSLVFHISNLQIRTKLPLSPGKEKERFVVIGKASGSLYKGPFAPNEHVKPVDVGAVWFPAPLTPSSDTSSAIVVLHLHGGAFVVGDARSDSMGYPSKKMLKYGRATHVLAPAYRLSTLPASTTSNPFPAALQDCLTAYLYLIHDLKISPSNIIISGDSAGANAAISILRYIAEFGSELDIPAPAAAWLWSPWVQPSGSTTDDFTRTNPNYKTDYLSYSFTKWGTRAYAGLAGLSVLSSPYISHLGHPFKTNVPLWVNTGGAEVLHFDDTSFAEEMKAIGNNVTLDVDECAPHDIFLSPVLGFDKEFTATAKRAGEWFREVRK